MTATQLLGRRIEPLAVQDIPLKNLVSTEENSSVLLPGIDSRKPLLGCTSTAYLSGQLQHLWRSTPFCTRSYGFSAILSHRHAAHEQKCLSDPVLARPCV